MLEEEQKGITFRRHVSNKSINVPYIIKETSDSKFFDVVARSKLEAVQKFGYKGIFKETSAKPEGGWLGVYTFKRWEKRN